MKNTQTFKLFLAVLLCTTYIVSFSNFGVLAYDKLIKQGSLFPENTTVAGIDISGKTDDEVLKLLSESEQDWLTNTTITVHFKETADQFELSNFEFLTTETVAKLTPNKHNPLLVNLSETSLAEIQQFVGDKYELDENKLEKQLISFGAQLKAGDHTVKLEDYLAEPLEDEVIATATIHGFGQLQQLQNWTEQFALIDIKPNNRFSLLTFLEEHDETTFSNETLSVLATAFYEIALSTNFQIAERNISRELPHYAELGFDAKVDQYRGADFAFLNPNDISYVLQSDLVNDTLEISLIGPSFKYEYRPSLSSRETIKGKTVIQYSPLLSKGEKEIKEHGKDGVFIEVSRETIDNYGAIVKTEKLSEDYYRPVHKIVVHSLVDDAESENNLNDNDDSREDPNSENDIEDDENNDNELNG